MQRPSESELGWGCEASLAYNGTRCHGSCFTGAPVERWPLAQLVASRQQQRLLCGARLLTTVAMPWPCRLKIGGVPFYIIGSGEGEGKRYALSGAQPVSSFIKVVERVLAERQQGSQ